MFWYFKLNLLYYFNKEYFLELKKFYDKTLYQYIKFCKINNVLYYFNEEYFWNIKKFYDKTLYNYFTYIFYQYIKIKN